MIEYVDTIKEMVSCKQFAEFMGLTVNRSGFAVCPFHADKDASMKIYNGDRGWVCYGCHKGGDVINMASLYYGLPFKETISRLNNDFNLCLPLESAETAPERLLLAVQRAKRITDRLKKERATKAVEREYWHAYDLWLVCCDAVIRTEPNNKLDVWNDIFTKSLTDRENARIELQIAMEKRCDMYAKQ